MKCPHCQRDFEHEGWTLDECIAEGRSIHVGLRAEQATEFWAHYASVGWVDGAGREITNLKAALVKWRFNQASHGKTYKDQQKPRANRDYGEVLTMKVS